MQVYKLYTRIERVVDVIKAEIKIKLNTELKNDIGNLSDYTT